MLITTTLIAALVFTLDTILPLGVAAGVPYVALVLTGFWYNRYIYHLATISTSLIVIGYLLSPDGGIFWMALVNRGLAIFVIWLTAYLLISRNKLETRQKMRSNELEFQKFALDEHAIVSIADVKGNITYVNEKFCEVSGYSSEELLGQNHRLLFSGEHSQEFFVDLWKTIASGRTWHGEIKNKNKRGDFYWVRTTIVPNLNEQGKPFQYVGIRTEVTEAKARLAQLQSATKEAESANIAKSNFLAAMSHEIRTPMAGVIGMSELLLDGDLSSMQMDWATSIHTSGKNLLNILNEILDQSKLEAGMLKIAPIDFHLNSLINDTIQLFGSKVDEKGLILNVELDEEAPSSVNADPMRIGQILSNLLSNSLKFTENGFINVTVRHEAIDSESFLLRFSIRDSGIGIDEDKQNQLFEAFVQADSSISRTYGGTGLGLSISRQLAQLMGGEIGVSSEVGTGSTFWFTVMCHPATYEVEATDRRKSIDRWVASRPLNILAAEDNIANQQLVSAVFKKLNHQISIAENGKIAVDMVKSGKFDAILMDVRMPVMDGLQATSLIRAMTTEKSNIPIIALTADIAAGNIQEYMNIGMNDVCAKPIDLPVLLKVINKLLNEEIHTSTSNKLSVTKDQKDIDNDEDSFGSTIGDTSFTDLLNRVSIVADLTKNTDDNNVEPMNGLDPAQFASMVAIYEENLTEQCNELQTVFKSVRDTPANPEHIVKLKQLIHSLKGGGGSFGYNLVSMIAVQADDMLKREGALESADIQILSNQVDALSLVAEKKITGHGGKAGRLLLQGLDMFSGI